MEDRLDHAIKRETNMLWKGLSAAGVIIFTSDVFAATAPLLEMVPKNLGYCDVTEEAASMRVRS